MSDTVISVENLSKQYHLGVISTGTFYGDIKRRWARKRGMPDPYLKIGEADYGNRDGETIWALRDIDFDVKRGEALGIIGRNGAGKSTLLKILSQVTAPTSGVVRVKGRIASLLEVGTGFHPELTGRENIYLNGAIMGMTSAEVQGKFDEIVDFSGVEQFIDTPVKRYSSGMYVRLAFAVAAHLEPDILVVDEVLAVGDAEFQKKCLGKMQDVAGEGRTVLFVSHNMAVIQNLCKRSILLESGYIRLDGETSSSVSRYLSVDQSHNVFSPDRNRRIGDQTTKIETFTVWPNPPRTGKSVEFIFGISKPSTGNTHENIDLAVAVLSQQDSPIFQLYSRHMGQSFSIGPGETIIKVSIDSLPLAPGNYHINLWLGSGSTPIDWIQDCFVLAIESGFFEGGEYIESKGYPVLMKSKWNVVRGNTGQVDLE